MVAGPVYPSEQLNSHRYWRDPLELSRLPAEEAYSYDAASYIGDTVLSSTRFVAREIPRGESLPPGVRSSGQILQLLVDTRVIVPWGAHPTFHHAGASIEDFDDSANSLYVAAPGMRSGPARLGRTIAQHTREGRERIVVVSRRLVYACEGRDAWYLGRSAHQLLDHTPNVVLPRVRVGEPFRLPNPMGGGVKESKIVWALSLAPRAT